MSNQKNGEQTAGSIPSNDIFKPPYNKELGGDSSDIKWIAKFYFEKFLLDEIYAKVTRKLISKIKYNGGIGNYYDEHQICLYTRKIVSEITITPLVSQEKEEWKFPHFNNIELYLYELHGNESSIKLWNFTNINKKDVVFNNNSKFRRAVVIDYDNVNVEYSPDFKGQPSELILSQRNQVTIE